MPHITKLLYRAAGALGVFVIVAPIIFPALVFAQEVSSARALTATAQAPAPLGVQTLDSLIAGALDTSPAVHAAQARLTAARARVRPASLRADPVLMAGIINLPISRATTAAPNPHGGAVTSTGRDQMTMNMIGISQTIPYPGKLGLRRSAAAHEAEAAEASLVATRRQVTQDVRSAYYELAYLDRALEIVQRNRTTLGGLIDVTLARYGVGMTGQQDVLRARVEAARLSENAVSLIEQRGAALARLNAALDRPSDTPVASPAIPAAIAGAAVSDAAEHIRFVSATIGARAADSPLPPLAEIQATAIANNAELGAHEAMIAAQAARVEGARREYLPDVEVSLGYGQRIGYRDMFTATVAVPLAFQKRRKQDALVAGASADLAALRAEHAAKVNTLRAETTKLYTSLERSRAQLALYVKAILPQSRATLLSATSSYQVGRADFLALLDAQGTLFNAETDYFRLLSDFASDLGELERITGKEMLR